MGRKWGKRSNLPPPEHQTIDRRLARLGKIAGEGGLAGIVGDRNAVVIGVGPSAEAMPNGARSRVTVVIQAGLVIHGIRLTEQDAWDLMQELIDTLNLPPQTAAELRKEP